jgi:cytosine/uracil/thiamine/allantoin permease
MWSQALCLCHTNSIFWVLCLPVGVLGSKTCEQIFEVAVLSVCFKFKGFWVWGSGVWGFGVVQYRVWGVKS